MTIPNVHDKVVQIVRLKGPLMPSQINKELDTNIIFASAILSEMVDNKVLKITAIKVGGSPLYYYPGQEYKLQNFADKLGQREKEAYDVLRQKRVVKDDKMPPAVRVALRALRDFAVPLQVNFNGVQHLFWKWYLLPNEEANTLIKDILGYKESKPEPKREEQKRIEPARQEIPAVTPRREEPARAEEMRRPEPARREERIEPRREIHSAREELRREIPAASARREEPTLKRFEERPREPLTKPREEPRPKRPEKQKILGVQKEEGPKEEPADKFFRKVKKYFDDNNITMRDFKVVRKESEIDFVVEIPSQVGTLNYFCKAKNKKKVNDGDVSSVYIQAQSKKMPVLFITTGELTKKARDLVEKEFKNVSVKVI